MNRPTVFCADFADYPFMHDSALALAPDCQLIIGGQRRNPPVARDVSLRRHAYFDWRNYYRLTDFEQELDPLATVSPAKSRAYDSIKAAFLRSTDRVFLSPVSHTEQERLFYALVVAFEDWLNHSARPLTVFFAHTPHFPWHLVFHRACEVLGVPVYIFRTTQIADTVLLDATMSDQRQRWVRPAEPIDPTWVMDQAWARSPRMANSVAINERAERHAGKRLGPFRWTAIAWRYFRDRRYLAHHHYHRLGWRHVFAAARARARQRRGDLAYVDRHAMRQPPENAFVYFGLHYQPERTTVPEAGHFHDQIRAIRLLAAALPAGMTLAVKEHPRQLGDRRPSIRRLHIRRRPLYEAIQRIPNAVLIHPFVNSSPLIGAALMTASCNGSAVFEGLQAGIPGLTFAATWHSACASAPMADPEHLETIVGELLAKPVAEVRADYQRFLEDHVGWWFLGANDDRAVVRSAFPRERLAESVARVLRSVSLEAAPKPHSEMRLVRDNPPLDRRA